MLKSCGLPRNELVVITGILAIVDLFYWRFHHGARVMSEWRFHSKRLLIRQIWFYVRLSLCRNSIWTISFFWQSPLYFNLWSLPYCAILGSTFLTPWWGSYYFPRHSWPSSPIFLPIAIFCLALSCHYGFLFLCFVWESFFCLKVSFLTKILINWFVNPYPHNFHFARCLLHWSDPKFTRCQWYCLLRAFSKFPFATMVNCSLPWWEIWWR